MKTRKPILDVVFFCFSLEQEKEFDVPELIYNLNLLVDLTESDILHTDRQYVLLIYFI